MRVHPSELGPKSTKLHIGIGALVGLILLSAGVFRSPKQIILPQAQLEKRMEVIVAKEGIQAGQSLDKVKLVLEARPVTTLPRDVVASFDLVKNKIAAGPIPAGYPLALSLLAEPIAVVAPVNDVEETPVDPAEVLLKQIEAETVAVPVTFSSSSPARGARIALTLSRPKGDSLVVLEETWVSSAMGREAVLRVNPNKALMLSSLKNTAAFGFIEIPTDGPSPYAGTEVASLDELKSFLEGQTPVKSDKKEARMKGYAWVSGEGIRYGIDDQGSIKVVDQPAH